MTAAPAEWRGAVTSALRARGWKGSGDELTGRCLDPAHEDGTPSATWSIPSGCGTCHGCGARWSTREAAALVGVHLSNGTPPGTPEGIPRTWKGATLSTAWTYRDAAGAVLGYVARYDGPLGKACIPYFRREGDRWRSGAAPVPRPLYGLDRLATRPDAPVLVAEGEKAADAAARLLPDYVTVTWAGGCKVVGKADWKPLAGRIVAVWPDHDQPGREAGAEVVRVLRAAGCEVALVDVAALDLPESGDAADLAELPGGELPLVGAEEASTPEVVGPLPFYTVRELAARVAAAGPRRFLLQGVWPAGDYGVHAAEPKAQKTWNAVDAAVSVASGTPWLGFVPVDVDPGTVLLFAGEGGEGNILRRLRATAEARGLDAEDLPLMVCPRAPHLGDETHLGILADRVKALCPRLVILDPLYLSAKGAKLGDLYGMGALLERPQHVCADAGASMLVVHHFNRNREAKDGGRITGAGPQEWGRVLITGTVVSRRKEAATRTTDVVVDLNTQGGEIDDRTYRLRRRIWADDPDSLESPLHLETSVEEIGDDFAGTEDKLPPAAQKLLDALADGPATADVLVGRIARRHGHGLRRETASRNLNELRRRGLAEEVEGGPFKVKTWQSTGDPDATA